MYEILEIVVQAILYVFNLPLDLEFMDRQVTLGSLFVGTSLIGLVSYVFYRIHN